MNLNRSLGNANVNVDQQQASSWLDTYTRAVHAEFVAYNPTINMVAAVTITFELPPMGGVFKSFEVFTVSMYSSLRKHPAARIVGEVLAAICLVVMIYRVVLTIFHDKCRYFTDLAKVLDLIFVLTGVVIIFLKVLKEGFKKLATDQFKEDQNQFLDYYQCGFYDELTDYAFAFLNFIAIVRFSVFLQFLSCLDHILRTIARCFYEFLACLFVFFCLMMAFTSLFNIAFNGDSIDFKDFSSSLQTSISYMARMVRSDEGTSSHAVVRAVALFSCCVTLIFFYLTVIRSVFIVGYRQILMEDRGRPKEKSFESGIFEIFVDKLMEITGIEKEEVIVEGEDDSKEVRLRAQKNYINKSQFVRLQLLINEAYMEDFVDDLKLFEVMRLESEFQSSRNNCEHNIDCGDTDVRAKHIGSINEEAPELKQGGKENSLKDGRNDGERAKTHVRFNFPPQDIAKDSSRKTTADEDSKLKLLEKLVEEKMRTLRRQQEGLSQRPEAGSVEHEIEMLSRLQQRIDATKRNKTQSVLPSEKE